ncbi:Uncharacterized protein dnm_064680 [Desulfonema magnum]|uniref:Uncharacterized protein n=1 Tax=Desulfonema magnum TaxID=45655 RepID=A0A975BS36_9BACT|nr:Uncharacterized protein dnm_064680 [Desulfonema magnum]
MIMFSDPVRTKKPAILLGVSSDFSQLSRVVGRNEKKI